MNPKKATILLNVSVLALGLFGILLFVEDIAVSLFLWIFCLSPLCMILIVVLLAKFRSPQICLLTASILYTAFVLFAIFLILTESPNTGSGSGAGWAMLYVVFFGGFIAALLTFAAIITEIWQRYHQSKMKPDNALSKRS